MWAFGKLHRQSRMSYLLRANNLIRQIAVVAPAPVILHSPEMGVDTASEREWIGSWAIVKT